MKALQDLRRQQADLAKKRDELASQRSAAAAEHRAAAEALASGTGSSQAIADAQAKGSSLDSAIEVLGGRLTAVLAAIAPLEVAAKRERQIQSLRGLTDRAVALHAELLSTRQQAAERVAVLLNEVFGSAGGYGGRLRELHQLLHQMRDTTEALSPDRSRDYGALSALLDLPPDSACRTVVRTEIPGYHSEFSHEYQLESLPDLGLAGVILDQLAATLRPATAQEMALLNR